MSGRLQKRSVCRYFASGKSCYYGDHCQYLHCNQQGGAGGADVGLADKEKDGRIGTPVALSTHKVFNLKQPPHLKAKTSSAVGEWRYLKQGAVGHNPSGVSTPRIKHSDSFSSQIAGGTTYFYTSQAGQHSTPPPYTSSQSLQEVGGRGYFTSSNLRQELLRRQVAGLAQPAPTDAAACPSQVEHYHSLCPLEPPTTPTSLNGSGRGLGQPSTCYRATSSVNSLQYCLRRVHSCVLTSSKAVQVVDRWKQFQHANVAALREMFTTKAFGDNSLMFAYDFHPGAVTLATKLHHMRKTSFPEGVLWLVIIQLVSGMRAVHSAGMALRCVDTGSVLATGWKKPRVLYSRAGMLDVLLYDSEHNTNVGLLQQHDLVDLGQLLVCLVMGVSKQQATPTTLSHSIEHLANHCSQDLQHLIKSLLGAGSEGYPQSISDVLPLIGGRMFSALEQVHLQQDLLEATLLREVENGRLFRLLAKLGVVNERADTSGSETGDEYLLKLFQQYLFHQVLPSGAAWVDLGHVVQTLNKLDAGVPEMVCLHSSDGCSVLIVSYADLKACLDKSFTAITTAPPPCPPSSSSTAHTTAWRK